MSEKSNINGVEVGELLEFKNICAQHPEKADRHPALVAYWEGGSRSRIEFKGMTVHLGGDGEFNPMQMFLATLVACDVDLIAIHAVLRGEVYVHPLMTRILLQSNFV